MNVCWLVADRSWSMTSSLGLPDVGHVVDCHLCVLNVFLSLTATDNSNTATNTLDYNQELIMMFTKVTSPRLINGTIE